VIGFYFYRPLQVYLHKGYKNKNRTPPLVERFLGYKGNQMGTAKPIPENHLTNGGVVFGL
jgi:hypothetical protein